MCPCPCPQMPSRAGWWRQQFAGNSLRGCDIFCPRCRVAGAASCRCSAALPSCCRGLRFPPLERGCFQQECERPSGHVPWRSAARPGSSLAPVAAHYLPEPITWRELPDCASSGLYVLCNELPIIMLSITSSPGMGHPTGVIPGPAQRGTSPSPAAPVPQRGYVATSFAAPAVWAGGVGRAAGHPLCTGWGAEGDWGPCGCYWVQTGICRCWWDCATHQRVLRFRTPLEPAWALGCVWVVQDQKHPV